MDFLKQIEAPRKEFSPVTLWWWSGIKLIKKLRWQLEKFIEGGLYNLVIINLAQDQIGIHVEIIEMCDLDRSMKSIAHNDIERKMNHVRSLFEINGDSPSDPIARKPTDEQLRWSCTVAAAQEKMVKEYDLDALVYYYLVQKAMNMKRFKAVLL